MRRKHKMLITVLILFIGVFLAILGAKAYIEISLERLADSTVSNVDLSKIDDGVYTGGYEQFPITAEVKVTINNHKITGIELIKHDNGQGKAAETIPDKVLEAQSLEVDIVSGATYSSKVILKAIENALKDQL